MSHDVDVLNRLIVRLRAAANGYRKAGAGFEAPAAAHDATAESLGAEVQALGAAPAASPGLDLSRHAWDALAGAREGGDHALAEATERAEAELLAEFQAALADPRTSGPVRDAILRTFDAVKARHDAALQRLDAMEV